MAKPKLSSTSSSAAVIRGANDNPASGDACVTDAGAVLPSLRFQAAACCANPPPDLVRLVEALARRAAREDYLAARNQPRNHEKPE